MTESNYIFYALSEEVSNRLGFNLLPFPVRADRANAVFQSDTIALDALLDELDGFIMEHPEYTGKYQSNAAKLALICATTNVANDDFRAALANLNVGLRIYPQHQGLKVHQALTLQINGYAEAAAREYEQLLWDAPQAFDPLIRALAVKAFVAIGQKGKGLEILEFLPERAFLDPSLQKLRESLLGSPAQAESSASQVSCPASGTPLAVAKQPNPNGEKQQSTLPPVNKKFCTKCGNKLKPGIKFCTACGTAVG